MTLTTLINAEGNPQYGYFDKPLDNINYMDFDFRSVMDKKKGLLAKKFGFNQFNFISFASSELLIGLAIVDLKWGSNAFIYIYHPQTKEFEEFSFISPLAMGTKIDTRPNNGESHFIKGNNKLSITASTVTNLRKVKVSLAKGLEIDAVIDETSLYNPLNVCVRAGYQGWVYTQKATALTCSGTVKWKDQTTDLKSLDTLAAVDWSCGYMRRETAWNWGSLSARLPDKRTLGFNFAAGVNETGFSENAIWIDGIMEKVDMIDFQFDRHNKQSAWGLRSNDGKIDLHFEPDGNRSEKINALFIASNFRQYFGRYYGNITTDSGEVITLDGELGLTEDHYAKW